MKYCYYNHQKDKRAINQIFKEVGKLDELFIIPKPDVNWEF